MAEMGRPLTVPKDLDEKVEAYLNKCENDKKYPSLVGLCLYLGVSEKTVESWRKNPKLEHISGLFEKVIKKGEEKLLEKGLNKEYDAGLVKFILSARHEYREKSEVKNDTTVEIKGFEIIDA